MYAYVLQQPRAWPSLTDFARCCFDCCIFLFGRLCWCWCCHGCAFIIAFVLHNPFAFCCLPSICSFFFRGIMFIFFIYKKVNTINICYIPLCLCVCMCMLRCAYPCCPLLRLCLFLSFRLTACSTHKIPSKMAVIARQIFGERACRQTKQEKSHPSAQRPEKSSAWTGLDTGMA